MAETQNEQPHLILVDGSGYIFRAFHALPPMTRPDGTPVNAVYGFTGMIANFLSRHASTHLAVVFDSDRRTFRNDIYPDYKAHRPEPPPELIPQFALIREATDAFCVPRVEKMGFEADDLIAAYAKAFVETGGRVTIVSSDKDLMQLVRDGVSLMDPIKQKPINAPEVYEKFGVAPDKVVDVQALAGDATDNVPGVPGIGIKTAATLINEFGDLENLLANAHTIKQPKRRESLIEHAEKARISRRLVLLDENAPLPCPVEELAARAPEPGRLAAFLRAQGFRSIVTRLGLEDGQGPAASQPAWHQPAPSLAPPPPDTFNGEADAAAAPAVAPQGEAVPFGGYQPILTSDLLAEVIAEAQTTGLLAIDTETDSLDALNASLIGISLATAPGRAWYIPLRHEAELGSPTQLEPGPVIETLRPVLEDPSVLKILHHAKYDLKVLGREANGGLSVAPVDDTLMISYSLDAGRHGHGMDELASRHLGHSCISYDEVTGTGRNRLPFARVAIDRATAYAAEDADVTLRLWQALKPRLRVEKALATYETIERRMVTVLRGMEEAGIKVDGAELGRIGEDFTQRMAIMERNIHDLVGRGFNLGSPKQLGEILFDEMKLPGGKRTKTGAWGTDASVLEDLAAQGHALPRMILDWRQLQKLQSTYVVALAGQIAGDGRVHTDYSMATTSTGRLASSEPNLQNIPIRSEEGVRIRRAFVAAPGNVLLAADYSQIELRLLAHLAEVPTLREAFAEGQDIHARTASEIFKIPLPEVDKEARRRAKTINFGIIYGMSAFGLAARLGIPAGEARGIIDAYFGQYPGIRACMEKLKEDARINGFVETPFGRKLWIDGIQAKEMARRGNAERAAINAPFQGGAAEIIKRAMVRIPKALADAGLSARMLLQVHDELVFEVPEAEREATGELVQRIMEGVAVLRVPLKAELGWGANWAQAH
ncbi:DNA polymerase I [Acetobacteraceae bacterium H6797]|nr:DNA polymerase I [Acetobacteraceae bacterium H6797]